jgi:hypothetical protein
MSKVEKSKKATSFHNSIQLEFFESIRNKAKKIQKRNKRKTGSTKNTRDENNNIYSMCIVKK